MHFLLTNDDGIDAPGLATLMGLVEGTVSVVAPQQQLSGCGHQVTTDQPIAVDSRSERAFAVAGTPADCVRLGLHTLLEAPVDWVLSGINAGGNLGVDVYTSGTVAAVREAAFHRIPGIAISHYRAKQKPYDWDYAAQLVQPLIQDLIQRPIQPGEFWNVNLPHLNPGDPYPPIVDCPLCTQALPIDYRFEKDQYFYAGRYEDRKRDLGADTEACLSGQISITRLSISL